MGVYIIFQCLPINQLNKNHRITGSNNFRTCSASTNFAGSAAAQIEMKAVLIIVLPAMSSATIIGRSANS
ncbi:MAG: hypothetical protein ICV56_09655 [Nitrososphaeraceae archaeon]|nr:hypothetical protein [Nitrososphaeraceae archaeon]